MPHPDLHPLPLGGHLAIARRGVPTVTVHLADGREVTVLEHVWGLRYSGDLRVVAADVRPDGAVSILAAERVSDDSPLLRVVPDKPLEIALSRRALVALAEIVGRS